MGIGSCCLYDVEAATGVVIARNDSNRLAVTLPAEWHCREGCRCIGMLKRSICEQDRTKRKKASVLYSTDRSTDHRYHEDGRRRYSTGIRWAAFTDKMQGLDTVWSLVVEVAFYCLRQDNSISTENFTQP